MANPVNVNGGSLQINYSLASQNVAGNYSVVNWSLQLVNTGGGGSSSYYNWNFQYPAGSPITSGSGGWIYAVNNTVFASGQITVYHDVNGNATANLGAYFQWYNGSGTATASYVLPRIAKAPTIATTTSSSVTANSATIAATVSSNGNGASTTITYFYRKSGVGSYVNAGTGSSKALSSLSPNTTYQWYVTATNNNGDVATSGVQTFKTKSGVKVVYANGTVEDRIVKMITPAGVVTERVVNKIL